MKRFEFLRRHEKLIVDLISWFLFLSCSVGLCGLSYECIKKYLEYPQGIDVSYQPQHKIEFPAFNFCPVGMFDFSSDPQPLKEEIVKQCGLKMEDMKTHFIGKGSKNCTDPVFWDRVSLTLRDLGIKDIWIRYYDGNRIIVPIDDKNEAWTKFHSSSFGTCFTLSLSSKLTSKDIWYMAVGLDNGKSLYMVVHQDKMLNVLDPWITKAYVASLLTGDKGFVHFMSFSHMTILDTKDDPCEHDGKYNLVNCMTNNLQKVFLFF